MIKKLGSYLLVPVLLLGAGTVYHAEHVSAQTTGDIQQEINDLQKKQNRIQKEKDSLSTNKQETEEKIHDNLDKQGTLEEQLEQLQAKLKKTKNSISEKTKEVDRTNERIEKLEQDIRKLNTEISELRTRIQKREEILKNRLQAIQENGGDIRYLEVLMGARSIGDFISRSSSVNVIMDQDQNILKELDADKKAQEAKKASIEEKRKEVVRKKAVLEEKKQELESLKEDLDSQKSAKDKVMNKLKKEHKHLESYKVSLEDEQEILAAQEKAVQEAISMAQSKKVDLERQAEQEASTPSYGSVPATGGNGLFSWPAQGRLSSGYGHRWGTLHAGLDIANSIGTPVKAAAPGVVISTNTPNDGKMNGYGNVVLIAHSMNGTTYTTLYAHMNSMSVSAGDHVDTGDQIGEIGNTGQSTGPHLHFEVHRGGWNAAKSNSLDPATVLK